jgi:hypothetical protein
VVFVIDRSQAQPKRYTFVALRAQVRPYCTATVRLAWVEFPPMVT